MSTQPTGCPARIAALTGLVDRLAADPLTAHLVSDSSGIWTVDNRGISLIQHAAPATADQVLDLVGDLIGSEFVPGRAADRNNIEYNAVGEWAGERVSICLFAPGVPVEEQLRARVAELEAELEAELAAKTASGARTPGLCPPCRRGDCDECMAIDHPDMPGLYTCHYVTEPHKACPARGGAR